MAEKKKLTKVILEFDNGYKKYLEGNDAQIWLDALDSAIVNDFVHGGKTQEILKKLSWKK